MNEKEINTVELTDVNLIIKRYTLRVTGRNGRTVETSIPREVVEREARRQGLTLTEALERLEAVWRYNSFRGLLLSFEPREEPIGGYRCPRRDFTDDQQH
jgi:hypothetical protein